MHRITLKEIEGDNAWTDAERQLLEEARTGFVLISDTRPTRATTANRIRAALIPHILRGGCEGLPVPPGGVMIVGAVIEGEVRFVNERTKQKLSLKRCLFDSPLHLNDATLGGLYLTGSEVPGIMAHGLICKGVASGYVVQSNRRR